MSTALSLSAQSIGSNFTFDPELELPDFPYFPPEIVILPFKDSGLLFEGAKGTQVISGRGARGFLPRLIAALDGRTSRETLCRSFSGVAPRTIEDALALLYSRGLLESGSGPADAAAPAEMLAFFGRYADATRVNANRHQAAARLAAASIGIAGNGPAARTVRDALSGQGFARVALSADGGPGLAQADLIVAVFSEGDTDVADVLHDAWARGIPALHANIGAETVEIGPLFMPGQSACYACFRAVRPKPQPGAAAADTGFWAGVVALQAHHTLSRIGNPSLYNVSHVHVRHAGGSIVETVKLARLPGCAACGLGHCRPVARDPHSVIWLLHNAANTMPPRRFHNPRDYQMHYAAANIEVSQRKPEPWYGAPATDLPRATKALGQPAWTRPAAPRALDLAGLSAILQFAAGERPFEPSYRLAPSAGGLKSPELFLAVRTLDGLPASVYRYDPAGHRLERLGCVPDALLSSALGVGEDRLAPVIVVGAGNTAKLQQKYNDFTFRFAHLDAGVVRLYLHDVAGALGVAVIDYADARDGVLSDALSIPTVGGSYIVTFAIGLGAAPGPLLPRGVRADNYVGQLIELSSRPLPAPPGDRPVLVADGRVPADLATILLGRRSARRYADKALPEASMLRIARLALDAHCALQASGAPRIDMKLWAAAGAPGCGSVRLLDADRRDWRVIRPMLRPDDLQTIMLQRALAKAPLVLLFTANFEDAVARHGARGYREIISRAGSMAARAILAAEAEGLVACPWGGLTEDAWGDLLGIDRYTDCPLFGVSIGYSHDAA